MKLTHIDELNKTIDFRYGGRFPRSGATFSNRLHVYSNNFFDFIENNYNKNDPERDQIEMIALDQLVPQEHLVNNLPSYSKTRYTTSYKKITLY